MSIAAASAHPMQAITLMAERQQHLQLNALSVAEDGTMVVYDPAPPARFRFTYRGLWYRVLVSPRPDGFRLRLTAPLGCLPYTAQDRDRRSMLLSLLRRQPRSGCFGFATNIHQNIWLVAEFDVAEAPTPAVVFLEIVEVIHQSRPFVGLILENL